MSHTNIWFFIIPFIIAAALPGPAQGTLIATVMTRGRPSAAAFVVGMVTGNAVWLVATIFGLASIALRYENLFIAIKWCGVAYLLFVAYKLWTAPVDQADGATQKPKGFTAGILLTLGNPKALVFFGAILPQAFDLGSLSVVDALLIIALGILIDTLVQTAYLFGVLRLRVLFNKPEYMRRINRTAAALIGGCALLVARR
ncbi:MAG TPA: LysE family translocator [Duganella sp.]|uniref:LysE family translocator n=1 Tax=Duganella sp. TaxID=1904440 RepID=UPI002ED6657B